MFKMLTGASLRDVTEEAARQFEQGNSVKAFELACVAAASPEAKHVQNLLLGEAASGFKITKFDPNIRQAILNNLYSDSVDHRKMLVLWTTMLLVDPAMESLMKAEAKKDFQISDWEDVETALHDPFLTEGLRKLIIPDIGLENFFKNVRRVLLLDLWPAGKLKTKNLSFICALAEQCFMNEYIYSYSDEEKAALGNLPMDNPIAAAIAGCYQPLYTLSVNPKISAVASWRQLARLQIIEPLREQEIITEIESFSEIKDKVSLNVQKMYEQNPYPRWRSTVLPARAWVETKGTMLVAGCGTGRTVVQAGAVFPNIEITAIDISKRSLAYAMRMSEEKELKNVSFLHGDIMDLEKLNQNFDVIECSGVLHHMADPVEGWRKLLARLNPGGRMMICLYSTKARKAVKAIRAYIAEKGYESDPDSIRALRTDVLAHEKLEGIQRSLDFYTLSETRDLLFHVQETTYTLSQLKEILDDLGLEFLKFRLPSAQKLIRYRTRFPEDLATTDFANWDQMEDEDEHFFSNMYQFVCMKKNDTVQNLNALEIARISYNT